MDFILKRVSVIRNSFFYFAIIKLKKNLISIISVIFVVSLILYSQENIEATKNGLNLWVTSVVPSLFPFFIATEILCQTNIINFLGKVLQKPVSKLFNVPGEGVFALIMGTISGYPSRCKNCRKFKKSGEFDSRGSREINCFYK